MRWMLLQYRVNKCVFKSLRKLSLVTLGSLICSRPTGQQQRKPVGLRLQPVMWKYQELSTGGPEMLLRSDVGDR